MAFGLAAVYIVFGSEMNLKFAELEPKSASSGKGFGLGNLSQAKYAAIKFAGFVLGSDRNTDLCMMSSLDHLFFKFLTHTIFDKFGDQALNAAAEFEDLFHQR